MDNNFYLSTELIEAKIRDEVWRHISSPIYGVDPWFEKGQTALIGTGLSRPFGSMTVGSTTFNAQKCWRDRQVIARSGLEMYVVQLVLAGTYQADFNGIDADIRLGDVVIHDLTQVMNAQITAGARLSIVMARSELQRFVLRNNLHGVVLRAENPGTRLLSGYMLGLDKVLGDLQPDAVSAAQEALLMLLASAINGGDGNRMDVPINLPMRQRVIDYIDQNLANPELSALSILRHFRVSRSHLYRAFEADGGIAKFIRDRRLDSAYRMLAQRKARPLSMKEIIYRSGLPNSVHFAKIFKDRFGLLPTEVRHVDILRSAAWNRPRPLSLHNHFREQISNFSLPDHLSLEL